MTLSSIEMYNLLRNKIGEKEAQAVTEYISSQVKENILSEKEHLATKKDVAEAKSDILKWMIVLFAPFYVGMIVFLVKEFL